MRRYDSFSDFGTVSGFGFRFSFLVLFGREIQFGLSNSFWWFRNFEKDYSYYSFVKRPLVFLLLLAKQHYNYQSGAPPRKQLLQKRSDKSMPDTARNYIIRNDIPSNSAWWMERADGCASVPLRFNWSSTYANESFKYLLQKISSAPFNRNSSISMHFFL